MYQQSPSPSYPCLPGGITNSKPCVSLSLQHYPHLPVILSSWKPVPIVPFIPVDLQNLASLPIILSSWIMYQQSLSSLLICSLLSLSPYSVFLEEFTPSPPSSLLDLQNTEALSPLFCLPGGMFNSLPIPVDFHFYFLSHYSLESSWRNVLPVSPLLSLLICRIKRIPTLALSPFAEYLKPLPLFCLPGGMYQQSLSLPVDLQNTGILPIILILKNSPHYSVFLEECTNSPLRIPVDLQNTEALPIILSSWRNVPTVPFVSLLICGMLKHSPHYSVFLEECTNSPLQYESLSPLFCLPGENFLYKSLRISVDLQNTEASPIILSSWRNVPIVPSSLLRICSHYSVFLKPPLLIFESVFFLENVPFLPFVSLLICGILKHSPHYSVFLEECTNSPFRSLLICGILKHSPHYSVFLEECTNQSNLQALKHSLLICRIQKHSPHYSVFLENVPTVPFLQNTEALSPIILSSWRLFQLVPHSLYPCLPGGMFSLASQLICTYPHYSVFLKCEVLFIPLILRNKNPIILSLEECTYSPLRILLICSEASSHILSSWRNVPGPFVSLLISPLLTSPHYSVFLEEEATVPFVSLLPGFCLSLPWKNTDLSHILSSWRNVPTSLYNDFRILKSLPLFCLPGIMYQPSPSYPVDLRTEIALLSPLFCLLILLFITVPSYPCWLVFETCSLLHYSVFLEEYCTVPFVSLVICGSGLPLFCLNPLFRQPPIPVLLMSFLPIIVLPETLVLFVSSLTEYTYPHLLSSWRERRLVPFGRPVDFLLWQRVNPVFGDYQCRVFRLPVLLLNFLP
ncbi:unnamed protein product [Acanthosepion pharaonis]|uniref:Uncharacterized protein n=1 Tax=Acanthosepion pharaonis TaxID=158019 RepID=A0A812C3M8_ACAPH|nr:unnamed protein product [Sepia pharaonis]